MVEDKVTPKKEKPTMEEQQDLGAANIVGAGNGAAVRAPRVDNHRRTLMEYAQPSIEGTASCIRRP